MKKYIFTIVLALLCQFVSAQIQDSFSFSLSDFSFDSVGQYVRITYDDYTYVYWNVYDSEGNQINSNYDDFNGSSYYNLSKDETYLIYIFENNGKTVGGTFTVTHAHYSEDSETVVEPTLAACGVDSFECDICGETVYGLTENTGNGKNSVCSGDFVYYIFSDGEEDETLEASGHGCKR